MRDQFESRKWREELRSEGGPLLTLWAVVLPNLVRTGVGDNFALLLGLAHEFSPRFAACNLSGTFLDDDYPRRATALVVVCVADTHIWKRWGLCLMGYVAT